MNMLLSSLFAVLLLTDAEHAEKIEVASAIVEVEDKGAGRSTEMLTNARETESLKITSERCDFDRTDGVVLFDGRAALEYSSGYTMNADRLFVYFVGSNEFDRVVCEGNVVFTNGMRVGSCDRAVFRRATGELVLFGGEDGSLARLAEQGMDEVAGRRIRFWVDTEQVEVVGSTLTIERGGSSTGGVSSVERKFREHHQVKGEQTK